MNRRSLLKFLSCLPLFSFFKAQAYTERLPETIEQLVEMMESRIPVGKSTNVQWSVTGEEYVEHAIGCTEPNKVKIKALIQWQWRTFLKEVSENPYGKLYWRIKPEYTLWTEPEFDFETGKRNKNVGLTKGRSYTRYLVSNKTMMVRK